MDQPTYHAELAWLSEKCSAKRGYLSLQAGTVLFHGYRSGRPTLNGSRAMWLASDSEEALMYAQYTGENESSGILTVELSDDIALPITQTSAARFLQTFDPDRQWSDRHDRYAMRLHEWGTSRHYLGVVEDHGSVVLFRPDIFLNVIDCKSVRDL